MGTKQDPRTTMAQALTEIQRQGVWETGVSPDHTLYPILKNHCDISTTPINPDWDILPTHTNNLSCTVGSASQGHNLQDLPTPTPLYPHSALQSKAQLPLFPSPPTPEHYHTTRYPNTQIWPTMPTTCPPLSSTSTTCTNTQPLSHQHMEDSTIARSQPMFPTSHQSRPC
jgi:hypothetical protein